jgi:hypothetical protein
MSRERCAVFELVVDSVPALPAGSGMIEISSFGRPMVGSTSTEVPVVTSSLYSSSMSESIEEISFIRSNQKGRRKIAR